MARILVIEGNTPGRVKKGQSAAAPFLRTFRLLEREVEARIANPFEQSLSIGDLSDIDGLIFTGSSEKYCVDAPEVRCQRRAMDLALASGLPIWGSCNGMQLAALVLGGALKASPNGMEIGVAQDLQLSERGRAHPMMAGRSNGFSAPCIHRDAVQVLPDGAQLMASNAHTPVQAFVWAQGASEVWATQYHPELSPRDVAGYIRAKGIFEKETRFLADLDAAESNPGAALRLGAGPQDMSLPERSRELINWLNFVEARISCVDAA